MYIYMLNKFSAFLEKEIILLIDENYSNNYNNRNYYNEWVNYAHISYAVYLFLHIMDDLCKNKNELQTK